MKKKEWSASGKCPICAKEFKSDACKHSYGDATQRLADDNIRAIIRDELKKIQREKDSK